MEEFNQNGNDVSLYSAKVLDVPITLFDSYAHAADCIAERIRQKEKTFCVAINPEKICFAHRDSNFQSLLNTTDIQICDGVGIVFAVKLLLGHRVRRCTGVGLFYELVDRASEEGWKVFFLGASQESNKIACSKLQHRYPNLKIVGQHAGFYEDENAIIELINHSQADVLFVALGSPKQEYWISKNRNRINASYLMGIGGTLDVVSGMTKRAPKFLRRSGLEFLYRLVKEPQRWRRQIVLPGFSLMVIKEMIVQGHK